MTAVVETFRKIAVAGGLKIITIQSDAACDTKHTIDLHSDATDGKGLVMTEICNTLVQDDAGADVTCTFTPSSGVIYMGALTTGIHNITVIGY